MTVETMFTVNLPLRLLSPHDPTSLVKNTTPPEKNRRSVQPAFTVTDTSHSSDLYYQNMFGFASSTMPQDGGPGGRRVGGEMPDAMFGISTLYTS